MMEAVIAGSVASLGLLVLCVAKRRRRESPAAGKDRSLTQLEDALRTAQLTNASFFQSLELVQKNLEALLGRAESAEQRLRALMLQTGAEKKERYTAAALLLGEGQEPERVASMLNLPLAQVQIVRELQKMTGKENKHAGRRAPEEINPEDPDLRSKSAARREKVAAYPVRLVDVIRKAASEATRQESAAQPFDGIHA